MSDEHGLSTGPTEEDQRAMRYAAGCWEGFKAADRDIQFSWLRLRRRARVLQAGGRIEGESREQIHNLLHRVPEYESRFWATRATHPIAIGAQRAIEVEHDKREWMTIRLLLRLQVIGGTRTEAEAVAILEPSGFTRVDWQRFMATEDVLDPACDYEWRDGRTIDIPKSEEVP